MALTGSGWLLEVERGPDWLFIKPRPTGDLDRVPFDLCEALWEQLETHFTYRLVLELDDVPELPSRLIGQLIMLHNRIDRHGGVLRLCGLNSGCQASLELCALGGRLRNFTTRADAVLGPRPTQPR